MPQTRSLCSLVLDRPRRRSVERPAVPSNEAKVRTVRRSKPLAHEPHRPRPTGTIGSLAITRSSRGNQIPITHAAPPDHLPRFPPLEVFRRRPQVAVVAAMSVTGRHPKTFTGADIQRGLKRSGASCDLSHFQVWGEEPKSSYQTREIPMHDTTTRPGAMVYVGFAAVLLMLYLM